MSLTIGLFGTCGKSRWRDPFVAAYRDKGIPFYNPQVEDGTWVPGRAVEEAWHLANDALVLFPITDETYAVGSLAEAGFSSNGRWDHSRFVVLYVAPDVTPALHVENPQAAQGSRRARQLVAEHLKKANNPNVFVVSSLDAMLETSLQLFEALRLIDAVRRAYVATEDTCALA